MSQIIPSLTTDHLVLRPLELADAPVLHAIYQMDGVLKYFPSTSPPALEKVERFILGQEKHWEKYGYGNWGILAGGEKEIAGWVGLQFLPELNETEVGFLLSRQHWGKGYATEAARASIRYGFEGCGLDQLIALVHPENLASRRVIEKCNLHYLETIQLWGIKLMRHLIEQPEWKANYDRSSTNHP